ncbi:hypothetical protein GGX14DRAFT_609929, partial [Mycena pura]
CLSPYSRDCINIAHSPPSAPNSCTHSTTNISTINQNLSPSCRASSFPHLAPPPPSSRPPRPRAIWAAVPLPSGSAADSASASRSRHRSLTSSPKASSGRPFRTSPAAGSGAASLPSTCLLSSPLPHLSTRVARSTSRERCQSPGWSGWSASGLGDHAPR